MATATSASKFFQDKAKALSQQCPPDQAVVDEIAKAGFDSPMEVLSANDFLLHLHLPYLVSSVFWTPLHVRIAHLLSGKQIHEIVLQYINMYKSTRIKPQSSDLPPDALLSEMANGLQKTKAMQEYFSILLSQPNVFGKTLEILYLSPLYRDVKFGHKLASHPKLLPSTAKLIAEGNHPMAKQTLALVVDLPKDVFLKLSQDPDENVRAALVVNQWIPSDQIANQLLHDPSPIVQVALWNRKIVPNYPTELIQRLAKGKDLQQAASAISLAKLHSHQVKLPESVRDRFLVKEHFKFPPTDTPAFRQWFQGSKVVDSQGNPLVVYHGTPKGGFYKFDLSEIDPHHPGFYFTDSISVADTYASSFDRPLTARRAVDPAHKKGFFYGSGIYRVYLRLVNPLEVNCHGSLWKEILYPEFGGMDYATYTLASLAKERGHDGVIFYNVRDEGEGHQYHNGLPATVYVVFSPNQVKSATANNGEYSLTDDDIRHNPLRRRTSKARRRP